ncbi:hypothetical protein HHK36_011472 [Tetracentron sinense]|uniref:Uncharacterized protein n=1 Tax=Tetracentron sinense TaxID=13715 RepID=A0A834ZAF7_TETSI|nr:hypothetical protein HHK36_011472 [Tetracentron sinense]
MADFPPNLDDGELWLPSDIFPDEVTAKLSPKFPSERTYMEDLAQQLAAYALLERNPNRNRNDTRPAPSFSPNSEFRPPTRYGPVGPRRTGYGVGVDGGSGGVDHSLYASGNGCFRVGTRPVYQYYPMKPSQTQVESFLQTRGRVLQRQQNQVQIHFSPFQVNGVGMSGFVRESGGTGVFLPRVATTTDVRKKQIGKNGQEAQQRQHTTKQVAVGKHERFQPPPEMGLPQDWTY